MIVVWCNIPDPLSLYPSSETAKVIREEVWLRQGTNLPFVLNPVIALLLNTKVQNLYGFKSSSCPNSNLDGSTMP